MPKVTNAPIVAQRPLSVGKDILAPASIFAGGAALGAAGGVNPVAAGMGLFLGHPITSAQGMLLTNPFQRLSPDGSSFHLSRIGMWGYKTLISGVQGGGLNRTLTMGNLVLSTVQGTARLLGGLGQIGTGQLATALRYARTVGVAGILHPSDVVFDLVGRKARGTGSPKMVARAGRLTAHGRDLLKNRLQNVSSKGLLSRLAGAGVITHADLDKALANKLIKIEGAGGQARVIIPALADDIQPKAVPVGKINTSKKWWSGRNLGVKGYRYIWRLGSLYAWMQLASFMARPAVGAALSGASALAVTTLDMLRNFSDLDITSGRLPQSFMTGEAATERQRAVQAIYGARVTPSNRFFGNEAQMYHQ